MNSTTSSEVCTLENEEGNSPPRVKKNLQNPNAYYLKNSQYLKKAERDPALIRSPLREGYLIPLHRDDLLDRYTRRYDIECVYDPIMDVPREAQSLISLKSRKTDEQRDKYFEIVNHCKILGIPLKEYQKSNDPALMILLREYEDIKGEIGQIERDFKFYENRKEQSWDDPIPLPDDLPPVLPLTPEMIPNPLRGWIMDIAERMQIPPDFSAASCVVVLGALIGRKVGIYPKKRDDWLVIPNLWGAIVGRPSLLKSPAIAEVMKPLDKLVGEAIKKHREDELSYERSLMVLDAKKSAFKDGLKQAAKRASKKGDFSELDTMHKEQSDFVPPERPVLKRYKTEDGTVEKIGEILQGNPQGILIHRDELSGWLKSMDKYGREGDRAFYLEAWNGSGSFTVDRIGRGTLLIPALCLSLLGGIQPGPLSSYVYQATSGGCGDDGLLQRFQILVWPDAPKKWINVDRFPNNDAKERAYEVFRKLDALEMPNTDDNEIVSLHFSEEAQLLFDEWREKLEKKLRSSENTTSMESHLAKFRSLMPSLALIFYLVEIVDEDRSFTTVSLEASQKAIAWCDYLESHASRLYSSGAIPEVDSARALLKKIKKGDLVNDFSPRDVYYGKHWARLTNRKEVEAAVRVLQDLGWLRTMTMKTGGRPTTKNCLHPSILSFL